MIEQSHVNPLVPVHQPSSKSIGDRVIAFFVYLTRPNASLTQMEQRRQSRLLAALTLTLAFTSSIVAVLLTARAGGQIPTIVKSLVPGILLTMVLYFLNRSGRYRLSAGLFLAQTFVTIYGSAVATQEPTWLLFTTMWFIFAALLTPATITFVLFGLSLATQIVLSVTTSMTTIMSPFGTSMVFLTTSSMILVFMAYRTGLERERQQELQTANKRLTESEALLEKRVQERTHELSVAKEQAEAARLHAEEADRVKSQFLSSMSHELRTPLNAILTFNELMAMGTFGEVNEEQVDYLQKSLNSGRHLLSLINDVLDITKIHAGMMKLFLEDGFDAGWEFEAIASSAEKMLMGKSVQLVRDIDHDLPPIRCDKRRVRQVMMNLLSNAVKFTEEGTITISAKLRHNEILLAVSDTGPGIAKEQQDIIFEPFVQTETGITHAGGTGLGLPISRSLVMAHGGQLWVDSTPGEGATFYVSLPLQAKSDSVQG
ncbi:MAG: hypothetical protein KF716_13100 [Anaerolineae bacterium]|nr:hypothetical protein [Anaerolineae bacterium]